MKYKLITYYLLFVSFLTGCEDIFFSDPPSGSPEDVYEVFWQDFDKYYGQFDIRNINWDSVYNVYRPLINSTSSDDYLLSILNNIVQLLKDGHVNIYTPIGVAGYYNIFPTPYSSNQIINPQNYLTFTSVGNSVIESAFIINNNIGYIIIYTFYSNDFGIADTRYELIDSILELFKDCKGIIIDVRNNGGGNSSNSLTIASRFANAEYIYYKQRYKNGPEINDYSDWINYSFKPKGQMQFTKPTILLTSRYTYSAAEIFVSAMQVLPNVTLIGDLTGGGIGNPVYRELPNGWSFRLSTSVGATADGSIIDGKGITPDISIVNPALDTISYDSRDFMLEKAIEVIDSISSTK